jgi:Flp pilus assembly protein TadG
MTIGFFRLPKAPALRCFVRDICGVAAVEFAILLPLMLTFYLGGAEIGQGLIANSKVTSVAEAISNLMAQQTSGTAATDSRLTNIFATATAIMSPYPTAPLKMTLSSVAFIIDSSKSTGFDAKTAWTITNNGGTPRPCQILTPTANGASPTPTTLPTGIYPVAGSTATTTVIIGDVTYTYTPAFGTTLLAWSSSAPSITFRQTTYMRPRNEATVAYSGSVGTICP